MTERGTCTKCIDEFFLRDAACLPCEYPCVNCLESDFCYSCGFDLTAESRRNIPPSCSCDYLYSDNGTRCVLCTSPCMTCETEALTDCLTCISGHHFTGIVGSTGSCVICYD